MKVEVDYEACESNAVCMGLVPEVFEVTDDDVLVLHSTDPPSELLAQVLEAVRQCPRQALTIGE